MFHIGRDGWLFLTVGTNRAADLYANTPEVWRMLRGWRRLLLTRAAKAERLGTRYLHLSSPEKLSVYDQKFFGAGPVRASRSPTRRLGRSCGSRARGAGSGSMPSRRSGPGATPRNSTTGPTRTGPRRAPSSPIGRSARPAARRRSTTSWRRGRPTKSPA